MTPIAESTVAERLSLREQDVEIVREVLTKVIPGRTVYAFGSRAKGNKVKQFSDLDLALHGELTWFERASLTEEFDESLLPIKVDVVELGLVDADFRERIEKDFVVVQQSV
jgi:predicted nucleotidyltransferase